MVPEVLQSFSLTLYKADTSLKRTLRVGPCCCSVIFFDSIYGGHLPKMGHLELVFVVLQPFSLTFYIVDTSLKRDT